MVANVFKMGLGSAEHSKPVLGAGALGLPWGCPGAPLGAGFWGELTWDLPEGRRRHLHTFLGWLEGLVVGVTQMLGRAWIPGGQHILDTVLL